MTHPLRRVAVLSPQPIVAEGLRSILAALTDRIEVVPFGPDGPEPDVVLYDAIALQHGDQSDLDALVNKTSSAVIIVSRDLRPGLAAQALTAGADGHISIGATPAEVLDAVASTAPGGCRETKVRTRRSATSTPPPAERSAAAAPASAPESSRSSP